MTEDGYTKREHDMIFGEIRDTLGRIEKKTDENTTQAKLTNGRVKELELERARQAGFYKAMSISMGVALSVAMSLSGWALYQVTNIDMKIANALSVYEKPIK